MRFSDTRTPKERVDYYLRSLFADLGVVDSMLRELDPGEAWEPLYANGTGRESTLNLEWIREEVLYRTFSMHVSWSVQLSNRESALSRLRFQRQETGWSIPSLKWGD